MPINSNQKGKRAERAWAAFLRDQLGIEARRGQQFQGSPDSPDVVCELGIHWEVKAVQALNLTKAMAQAVGDAGDRLPVVAHRKNRGEWLVTLRAKDLAQLSATIQEHLACRQKNQS